MVRLLFLLLLLPLPAAAESYFFANYGLNQLQLNHEYIVDAERSSPASTVGLGIRRNSWLAFEGSISDLGEYRFQLEKPVTLFEYRGYDLAIDVPGYAELRLRSFGLHAKAGRSQGLFLRLGTEYVQGKATLITPIGYRLYSRDEWVPSIGLGYQYRQARFGISYVPLLYGWSIGGQINF